TSRYSRNSVLTTASTIHRSRTPRLTKMAYVTYITDFVPHSPIFYADIHWQAADGELVTTYKTYHGTHHGMFLGVAPTGRKIHFETVDVMRVRNGKITDHWGVANLFSVMQQLGALKT